MSSSGLQNSWLNSASGGSGGGGVTSVQSLTGAVLVAGAGGITVDTTTTPQTVTLTYTAPPGSGVTSLNTQSGALVLGVGSGLTLDTTTTPGTFTFNTAAAPAAAIQTFSHTMTAGELAAGIVNLAAPAGITFAPNDTVIAQFVRTGGTGTVTGLGLITVFLRTAAGAGVNTIIFNNSVGGATTPIVVTPDPTQTISIHISWIYSPAS